MMTKNEMKQHARRILQEWCEDPEFSLVYEDPELEDEDAEVQQEIYDLLTTAKIRVLWNEDYE